MAFHVINYKCGKRKTLLVHFWMQDLLASNTQPHTQAPLSASVLAIAKSFSSIQLDTICSKPSICYIYSS